MTTTVNFELNKSKETALKILNMFDSGIVHLIDGPDIDRHRNALTIHQLQPSQQRRRRIAQKTHFFAVTSQTMAFLCASVRRYYFPPVHTKAQKGLKYLLPEKRFCTQQTQPLQLSHSAPSQRRINIAARLPHLHIPLTGNRFNTERFRTDAMPDSGRRGFLYNFSWPSTSYAL
ncbi:hypothetical protein BGZ61DRAFT_483102 [Ilyonectria robusta]|uniref:uncharacterized protein n=1 Tax=Ilyonectria robusta TaxID=1079257 RepID=UPI001E8D521A|nr:uncharacterized protein BGZ61DRAFT_483102 [Ilyonectria robusta]KAH8670769.1 hypothetical protein BGZ61DRAFT_483102 [Ilyonectria robusta]